MVINDELIGVMAAVTFKADKRFSSSEGLFYARIATAATLIIDQRRRLSTLRTLSCEHATTGSLVKNDLDLEIVTAISQLVKLKPYKKAVIISLIRDIQSFVES